MIASSLVEWMVDEVERLTQISMKLGLKTTFTPFRPLPLPIHDCRCSRAGEKTACSKPTTHRFRLLIAVASGIYSGKLAQNYTEAQSLSNFLIRRRQVGSRRVARFFFSLFSLVLPLYRESNLFSMCVEIRLGELLIVFMLILSSPFVINVVMIALQLRHSRPTGGQFEN